MNISKQKDPSAENIKSILKLLKLNKFSETEKEIYKQIKNYPQSSILFNILGAVFAGQNKFDESIKNYKTAINLNPNYAQAFNNMGIALHKMNKVNDAVISYKKAISLKNDFAEVYNNLGNAFRELAQVKESLQYFEKALKIKPDYAEAFCSLGAAFQDLGKKREAQNNFEKAINIRPDYAEAYNNMGLLLSSIPRFNQALLNYRKAISLNLNYEKAYNNLGNLLNHLGKYNEATDIFKKAIKIKPNYTKAYSNLLFNLNYKTNFNINLYLSEAKKFRINCDTKDKIRSFKYSYEKNPKKLKVGLVSADFGNHPGGFFTLSTLKELKKKDFELISYSTHDRKDEYSSQFKSLFSKWRSIEKKKIKEINEQIVKDGVHILIDLQGHSADNKLEIFISKPAPIQATWLGQGSTGIPEIDYFIGSPHITPKNEEDHFVEKVLRLPEISQCFTIPDFNLKVNNLPALKNNYITFGCFNKLTKINDDVVDLWCKILFSIPNSKILLKNKDFDDEDIVENVYKRFKKNEISKDRLILAGESNTRKELLEFYYKIDIALDPFPFQGNTSSCESVWMGVPVLTLKGNRYLFHFGESINSNLNMHDWIAANSEDYISKAIKFSSNLNKLSRIRRDLRKIAIESPVFNAPRFAENFSKILWKMWNNFNNL